MKEGIEILLTLGFLLVLVAIVFFLGFHSTGLVSYTDIENVTTANTYVEISNNFSNVSSMEEFIFNWDTTNYTIYNNSLVLMINFNNLSTLGENNTHIFDASLSQNNGTILGATSTTSGKYNGGFVFDGVDDYIDAGNDSSLNITEEITLSVWINSNSPTTTLGNVSGYKKINDTDLGDEIISGSSFGVSVANIGDLDGDGIIDLAVGAQKDDDGGTDNGAVYILFMNADGSTKSYEKINDTSLGGELDDGDYFGASITNIGDLDSDGITDLAIGADRDEEGGVL